MISYFIFFGTKLCSLEIVMEDYHLKNYELWILIVYAANCVKKACIELYFVVNILIILNACVVGVKEAPSAPCVGNLSA